MTTFEHLRDNSIKGNTEHQYIYFFNLCFLISPDLNSSLKEFSKTWILTLNS